MPEAPDPEQAVSYPAHWEADVLLADGGTMHVRPIRPDDGARLRRFHERQSAESIYYRFFSPRPRLTSRDVERFTTIDYVDRMAFIGLIADEMVGVARYDRWPGSSEAEVAFFTDDANTGRGMGTVMLEYLAAAARDVGVTGFTAEVLPQNRRMLSMFKAAGFGVSSGFADGLVQVALDIEPTTEARAAMEARANAAGAASVARLLRPRSVAVIGASRTAGTLGHDLFRRLLAGGFEGVVYPVNPDADRVASVRAYPNLSAVPDEIDLAVIVVPASEVPGVVTECGHNRVRGLVVISEGFAEAGPEGAAAERALVEEARGLGMRLIGPNTMGIINAAPDVALSAVVVGPEVAPGRIGVSSQSGTVGAALVSRLGEKGLGISTFVAAGNKADVSGNDLLQYWETDDDTDVVLLYLESFGNPRNFGRIARRVSRTKPIVAVKADRGLAPKSGEPTGWPPDATFDALLSQTGVIRTDTLEEMLHVAQVLSGHSLPRGPRVAVLSNFWGPATLTSDACRAAGLELVAPSAATETELAQVLRPAARVANPTQVTSEAGPAEMGAATRIWLDQEDVDALVVLSAPRNLGEPVTEVAGAVSRASRAADKPVVASFLGAEPADGHLPDDLAVFAFPEAAAQALGRVADYATWRVRPLGEVVEPPDCDAEAASDLAETLLDGAEERVLGVNDALVLVATHGIVPVDQESVEDEEAAVAAAGRIGYPVVLKALGVERPAKTEEGGVAVDVHGDEELVAAYRRMSGVHGPAMRPALVQTMAALGTDCALGVHQHPALGSIVTLAGSGSRHLGLAIVPLTDLDATRLIAAADVEVDDPAPLKDLLARLSALAENCPVIAELRCDPVLVIAGTAWVTDVRVRLARWRDPDDQVRRLG